jgi:hypothetical protein
MQNPYHCGVSAQFIYFFETRDKSEASTRRDMSLKQREQSKTTTKFTNIYRSPQVRCAQMSGAGAASINRKQAKVSKPAES